MPKLDFDDAQRQYLEGARHIAKIAVDRSESLYRYFRFSNESEKATIRAAIVDGHFRFARPRTFNDPFDCRPHIRKFYFFGGMRFRAATRKLVRKKFPDDPAKQELARKELEGHSQEDLIESTETRVRNVLLDTQLMLCLAGNRTSPSMWAHYADCQRGVCVHLRTDIWPIAAAMRVRYGNLYPSITLPPNDNTLVRNFALRKAKAWRHENEYRILVQDEDAQRFGLEWLDDNTAVFPPSAVAGVTAGCLMSEANLKALETIVAASSPAVPLYRAITQRNRFKLGLERVA